jgi:hypothetical protein
VLESSVLEVRIMTTELLLDDGSDIGTSVVVAGRRRVVEEGIEVEEGRGRRLLRLDVLVEASAPARSVAMDGSAPSRCRFRCNRAGNAISQGPALLWC